MKKLLVILPLKRFVSIGFLILVMVASCTHQENDFLLPTDDQDAEYALLIDSVEAVYDCSKYYDFTDSLISPALAFYEKGDRPRDYWMQARCHYLVGGLVFDNNHFSEEATAHFMEALSILDSHFDAKQARVGRLYSKICYILSRIAYNFSDQHCSTRFARYGLDCASAVGDTAWMIRSMANLGKLYERFGKAGEGDTAFFYCHQGLHMANADRFPYETALLENSLANCLRHSHEYDSAIFYFEQSFALVDSSCLLFHLNAIEKAYVHYKAHDYATALADSKVAYQSKDENIKAQASYCLVDCYEALGDTLSALPFYAILKTSEENDVVASNHNAEATPMLNAYLKEKASQKGREWLLWSLLLFVVSAVVVILMRCRHRKRMAAQEAEAQRRLDEASKQLSEASQRHNKIEHELQTQVDEAMQQARTMLPQRVSDIYYSKVNNRMVRIMAEFQVAYPLAMEQLATAYPDLNETERQIAVLNFLQFRAKEEADLLGFAENTILKYRSNLNKKAGSDPISALLA
jgi:hypothetical protein